MLILFFSLRAWLFIKRPYVSLYSYFHCAQTCWICKTYLNTYVKNKKNMFILKFHLRMKCLHVFFFFFFFFFSSRDEISSLSFNSWNFVSGWNSSRDEILPVYVEISLTVYTFLPRWNFILGWVHPGMKDRHEVSSRNEKKKKRRVNTSSWDEILKWACFFSFWRMYSNMFYKFNMFEHNESMNIMKHMASL